VRVSLHPILVLILIVGGAAAGAGLVAWGALNSAFDLLHRAFFARRLALRRRLEALRSPMSRVTAHASSRRLPWPVLTAVAIGALGAVLAHDVGLSLYLFGMGLAAAWFMSRWGLRPPDLSKQTEQLISAFRGQFAIQPTRFAALAECVPVLPEGPVRAAVETAIARNRVAQDDPLAPLRELPEPVVNRFVSVLDQVEYAGKDATLRLLRDLEERVRAQRRLREQAGATLRTLRNTVRFLAGVNVALAVGLWLVPLLRAYFVVDLVGRLVYIAVTGGAALGVAYFVLETQSLEEQVV
jgi:hypothetical protein